ncbi:helix-turn-helix domain-containing protein [Halomarina salina]|uniref:Helix-turn-helix domain-containing protein n=1 Tax=Halomarina salina TaxID=1872699 RepID=A0ABD5RMP6_9EURY|nr:helix-turn-helix domain-containing protein [Halomarina salina]
MSQSMMAPVAARPCEQSDVSLDTESVLDALDDANARCILQATSDEALSATELSEECDIPLSTTYRKVETLAEVGLLDERIRIRRSGKHTSEYRCQVDNLVVSVSASEGVDVRVARQEERVAVAAVGGR